MKKRKISRRKFIKGAAALGGAMFIPRRALAGPNGKLNIACIGCAGKGHSDTMNVRSETIVALCDVDERHAGGTFSKFPNAKKYTDYRRMFDEMGDEIDAVTVSTPDHNHFPASMMAIMMGKHVFCQKPLTHNVWEARALALAARKHKVATQMGIQGHSGEGARLLVEWVRAGLIGPVREVHYWTDRPIGWWPQGINRPGDTPTKPSHLDWDSWLGPAPERPYHPAYHPFRWRGWWDFGCGALGDIGCHAMDAAFWALELGYPTSVSAENSGMHAETAPLWSIVTYQFPARGSMPPVKVVWYDGNKKPPRPKDLEENRQLHGGGQLLFGDEGTIMADTSCGSPRVIPESRMRELRDSLPPKTIERSPGHAREWIRACKGGPPAGANFDFAGPLSEMVLMGNLAVRSGKPIAWDGPNMRVTNVREANRYVRREPRRGWEEPYRYGEKLVQPNKARPSRKKPERRAPSENDVAHKKAEQLYRMARQAERMRQRDAAASLYEKIVADYPDTSFAKQARESLKKLGR